MLRASQNKQSKCRDRSSAGTHWNRESTFSFIADWSATVLSVFLCWVCKHLHFWEQPLVGRGDKKVFTVSNSPTGQLKKYVGWTSNRSLFRQLPCFHLKNKVNTTITTSVCFFHTLSHAMKTLNSVRSLAQLETFDFSGSMFFSILRWRAWMNCFFPNQQWTHLRVDAAHASLHKPGNVLYPTPFSCLSRFFW